MPEDIKQIEIASLKEQDVPSTHDVGATALEFAPPRLDGRRNSRKTLASDKLVSVPTAVLENNSVTNAKMADDAIKQAELDYETADITITGTATSGTATVTASSIPIGYFLTAFTTPAASYVQLAVSGTTLTATLSTAPGAGNSCTIRVILLRS